MRLGFSENGVKKLQGVSRAFSVSVRSKHLRQHAAALMVELDAIKLWVQRREKICPN